MKALVRNLRVMQELLDQLMQVGPLRIAASAVAMVLVSSLWYSPFLFGKSWARLSGIRIGDLRPIDRTGAMVMGILICVITAALLALFSLHATENPSMLFMGVGFLWMFVMLEQLRHTIWERQPVALFLLHSFRALAALMAGAAVFYFWK